MLPKIHFERWKLNKDLNIYVSTYGNFRTRDKKPIKILSSNTIRYLSIRVNGKVYLAHRVVLSTFRPVENNALTVDHKDHNTKNNHLDNLEWVSLEENQIRAKTDMLEVIQKTEKIEYSPEMENVYNAAVALRKVKSEHDKMVKHPHAGKTGYICFGNYKVRSCYHAAEIILKEKEYPCSQMDVHRTASKIGEVVGKNKTLYGYKFEKRYI